MLKLAFITSSIVALDQALKFLIITRLQFQEIIEINSILKVVYFRNKGAAFGFIGDIQGANIGTSIRKSLGLPEPTIKS